MIKLYKLIRLRRNSIRAERLQRKMFNELSIKRSLKKYLTKENELYDGCQYIFKFKNNYGASVIRHCWSYGSCNKLWEVALLKNGELEYRKIVGYDVLGNLTNKEVMRLLNQIKRGDVDSEFR